MQQAMSAPQPHFVSIHRAISWAMSLLKVQLNICTKATLRADESGCCGEVGGGEYNNFLGSTCLLCSAYAYNNYAQDCPFDFDQKANDI